MSLGIASTGCALVIFMMTRCVSSAAIKKVVTLSFLNMNVWSYSSVLKMGSTIGSSHTQVLGLTLSLSIFRFVLQGFPTGQPFGIQYEFQLQVLKLMKILFG